MIQHQRGRIDGQDVLSLSGAFKNQCSQPTVSAAEIENRMDLCWQYRPQYAPPPRFLEEVSQSALDKRPPDACRSSCPPEYGRCGPGRSRFIVYRNRTAGDGGCTYLRRSDDRRPWRPRVERQPLWRWRLEVRSPSPQSAGTSKRARGCWDPTSSKVLSGSISTRWKRTTSWNRLSPPVDVHVLKSRLSSGARTAVAETMLHVPQGIRGRRFVLELLANKSTMTNVGGGPVVMAPMKLGYRMKID